MKRYVTLFFLVTLLSCSKDEIQVEPSLLGTWNFEKATFDSGFSVPADECTSQMFYVFNEDLTVDYKKFLVLEPTAPNPPCIEASEQYEYFTWELAGENYILRFKSGDTGNEEQTLKAEVEGNQLIITYPDSFGVTEYYNRN